MSSNTVLSVWYNILSVKTKTKFYFILIFFNSVLFYSMDGADLCFEIVNRVHAGFVYSEAVTRWELYWFILYFPSLMGS